MSVGWVGDGNFSAGNYHGRHATLDDMGGSYRNLELASLVNGDGGSCHRCPVGIADCIMDRHSWIGSWLKLAAPFSCRIRKV